MPVHPNFNPDHLYFVTTAAINHISLFQSDISKHVLADSLHFLRTDKRMCLYVFTIMPNHVHFIARFSERHPIGNVLRDFKRHTARQIIRQIQAEQNTKKLNLLKAEDSKQEYKVWKDGYDARDIFSLDFLQQKMDYIHWNPCQPKWNLAKLPEDYLWSSARFYLTEQPAVIPVDDVRELFV